MVQKECFTTNNIFYKIWIENKSFCCKLWHSKLGNSLYSLSVTYPYVRASIYIFPFLLLILGSSYLLPFHDLLPQWGSLNLDS